MSGNPAGAAPRVGWEPARLREARLRYGFSLEKASRQMQETAVRLGRPQPAINGSMMWKHEAGRVYPSQFYQNLYCATYGMSETELGFRLQLPGENLPAPRALVLSSALDYTAEHSHAPLAHTSDQLRKEQALAIQRSLRLSAYAGAPGNPEVVAQIHDEIKRLAEEYTKGSVLTVVGELIEIQGIAFAMTESTANPSVKRDLYFLSGIIAGLLAEANEDLGDFAASRIHGRTALICAENAGDNSLRSWARFQQMNTAFWSGAYQETLNYAARSAEFIDSVSGSGRPRIYATTARAYAALGDMERAGEAVLLARRARDETGEDELDRIGGQVLYRRSRQLYHEANIHLLLKDSLPGVEAAAVESLQLGGGESADERSYITESNCRVDLATGRILTGDVDGALDALAPVLDLAPAQRTSNLRTSLIRPYGLLLDRRLTRSSVARDFRLEIEEFCQYTVRTTSA